MATKPPFNVGPFRRIKAVHFKLGYKWFMVAGAVVRTDNPFGHDPRHHEGFFKQDLPGDGGDDFPYIPSGPQDIGTPDGGGQTLYVFGTINVGGNPDETFPITGCDTDTFIDDIHGAADLPSTSSLSIGWEGEIPYVDGGFHLVIGGLFDYSTEDPAVSIGSGVSKTPGTMFSVIEIVLGTGDIGEDPVAPAFTANFGYHCSLIPNDSH